MITTETQTEIPMIVSELKHAMSGLSRVLNKSASLPVLNFLRVLHCEDGTIAVQATDLDSFATYRFSEVQAGETAEMLVPFDQLHQILKGCAATDRICLVQRQEGLVLQYPLAGRQVERPLNSLAVTEWPATPQVTSKPESLDDKFKDALANAFECCSDDSCRAVLQGAWLDVTDPKAHYVLGTDGKHLYSANSFRVALKESLLIPQSRFLQWTAFKADGPWKLAVEPGKQEDDAGWIQIQSDHWSFITRRPEYRIPDWRQVVPSRESTRVTVTFSEEASMFLLDLIPKLPGRKESGQPIRLDVCQGKLKVTAKERDNEHLTTLPVEEVEVAGPDMTITVNRSFIAKALKWRLTVMEMKDELSPLVFTGQGRKLVAMPMRTEGPITPMPQISTQPESSNQTAEPQEPEPKKGSMNRTIEPSISPESSATNRLASAKNESSVRSAIEQIDGLKDSLKSVLRQFSDITDALR